MGKAKRKMNYEIKPSSLITKSQRKKMYGDYVMLKNNNAIPSGITFEMFLVESFIFPDPRH